MLSSIWITFPISVVLGFLSGLGTGGGSLLILWLTLILGMEPSKARLLNLMFFVPSALISGWFRRKQGNVNIRRLLPAIICGCGAAYAVSMFQEQINMEILKKAFGALLIFTGLRELFYRTKAGR